MDARPHPRLGDGVTARTAPDALGDAPAFQLAKSRTVLDDPDATILAYGSEVACTLDAADTLAGEDILVSVVGIASTVRRAVCARRRGESLPHEKPLRATGRPRGNS